MAFLACQLNPLVNKQHFKILFCQSSSSSEYSEDEGIDNPALSSSEKQVLFTAGPNDTENDSQSTGLPSFLSKLSKRVNFIQPTPDKGKIEACWGLISNLY